MRRSLWGLLLALAAGCAGADFESHDAPIDLRPPCAKPTAEFLAAAPDGWEGEWEAANDVWVRAGGVPLPIGGDRCRIQIRAKDDLDKTARASLDGIAQSAWRTGRHLTVKTSVLGWIRTEATCDDDRRLRLANVLVHEFGHLHGVSFDGANHSSEPDSVMLPGVGGGCAVREPTAADICAMPVSSCE